MLIRVLRNPICRRGRVIRRRVGSGRLGASVEDGLDGEYRVGELGHVNGKDLPSTAAGEELRVHWEVEGTDKSGDIPATKLSSEIDRIDIAADALAELDSADYDGKTYTFKVKAENAAGELVEFSHGFVMTAA